MYYKILKASNIFLECHLKSCYNFDLNMIYYIVQMRCPECFNENCPLLPKDTKTVRMVQSWTVLPENKSIEIKFQFIFFLFFFHF